MAKHGGYAYLTSSSSMISSMDSTLESSMTQVICSFLMPKPTGTSLAAHSTWMLDLQSLRLFYHMRGKGCHCKLQQLALQAREAKSTFAELPVPLLAHTSLKRHQHERVGFRFKERHSQVPHRSPSFFTPRTSASRAAMSAWHDIHFSSPSHRPGRHGAEAVDIKDNGLQRCLP